jgi:hypothetical protein
MFDRLFSKSALTWLALCSLVLTLAIGAAAAISLRHSGKLFDFRRPVSVVPVPVAAQLTMSMARATPLPTVPEPAPRTTPPSGALRSSVLVAAAAKTFQSFLAAQPSWEKLSHVVDPEDALLSISDYEKAAPIAADAAIKDWETIRVEPARRWISMGHVVERDGSVQTICFVHREDNGEAKLDFSLYWQNRANQLAAGDEPRTLRVQLKRLPGEPARLEMRQAYAAYPPVTVRLAPADPLAPELIAKTSVDFPVLAIVEVVPAEREFTITKVEQWGLWPEATK